MHQVLACSRSSGHRALVSLDNLAGLDVVEGDSVKLLERGCSSTVLTLMGIRSARRWLDLDFQLVHFLLRRTRAGTVVTSYNHLLGLQAFQPRKKECTRSQIPRQETKEPCHTMRSYIYLESQTELPRRFQRQDHPSPRASPVVISCSNP